VDGDGDLDLVTGASGPGGAERLFINVRDHGHDDDEGGHGDH